MPYRTGYVFKGHAHITRLRNGAISGHIIVISEYLVITLGHCIISLELSIMAFMGLIFGQGLSGGCMMRLAGRGIIYPVYSAISQRCFHTPDHERYRGRESS